MTQTVAVRPVNVIFSIRRALGLPNLQNAWLRLSAKAGEAIGLGQREALRQGTLLFDIPHLLLGVLGADNNAVALLWSLQIDPASLKAEFDVPCSNDYRRREGTVTWSVGVNNVLRLADVQAARLGSPTIGTEHLLLGLLKEGKSPVAQRLRALGISAQGVKSARLQEEAHKSPTSTEASGQRSAWGRFSEPARKSMYFAQIEASQAGDKYVSTEHVLVALLLEQESEAYQMLSRLGIDPPAVVAKLKSKQPIGEPTADHVNIRLSPRTRRAVDLAIQDADESGSNTIGPEHLLIGLMWERDGLAGRTLARFGLTLEAIKHSPPR